MIPTNQDAAAPQRQLQQRTSSERTEHLNT